MFNNLDSTRKNMAEHREESFKPILVSTNKGIRAVIMAQIRKLLDLQFGSIWRDVSKALPQVTGTVLDIGCGAQPFKTLFNPKHVKYIGIDTADSKSNFGYHHEDTLYYSGDKLPIENAIADFILCTETLEHILKPSELLNEMWRCLNHGGKILLTVPFAARWHFIPFDYWRYTPSSLAYLLSEAKFTNIRVYARGNALTVACYKIIGLILPLFFQKNNNKFKAIANKLFGLLLFPCIIATAIIANIITTQTISTDDCLGYTVLAEKK